MVIITNNNIPQTIYIPKVMGKSSQLGQGVLAMVSTADHREYSFAVVDTSFSGLYFVVSVTLEEGMASGEYEYALYDESGETASNGLVMLMQEGKVIPHPNIYEQTIQYEQYQ